MVKLPFQSWVGFQMSTDGLADHGVLSHKDDSMVTQRSTDLLKLFGSYIVSSDNEALGVLIQKLLNDK